MNGTTTRSHAAILHHRHHMHNTISAYAQWLFGVYPCWSQSKWAEDLAVSSA